MIIWRSCWTEGAGQLDQGGGLHGEADTAERGTVWS
jgi:hypothetical protein